MQSPLPNLKEFQRQLVGGYDFVRIVLIYALSEVRYFFGIKEADFTDMQLRVCAESIMEQYWYMNFADIKYCLTQARNTANIYNKLSINTIMRWLKDYDDVRAEASVALCHNADIEKANNYQRDESAKSFREYVECLQERANNDDKQAKEQLETISKIQNMHNPQTIEERHNREFEYRLFRTKYINSKKENKQNG